MCSAGPLSRVNSEDSELSGTDLTGARLNEAMMREVNMTEVFIDENTTFKGADLREAIFEGMNLGAVNLADARLSKADFSNAKLEEAIFDRARGKDTKFVNAKMGGLYAVGGSSGMRLSRMRCLALGGQPGGTNLRGRRHEDRPSSFVELRGKRPTSRASIRGYYMP